MEFVKFWQRKKSISEDNFIVFTIICFIYTKYIFPVCAIYQSDVKEVDKK